MVFAPILHAMLTFTYHWYFADAQLQLWYRVLASFCFLQICVFQVVTVLVETHALLHISYTIETYHKSSVTRFLTVSFVSQEYLELFSSYKPFSRRNMAFYGLSRTIFNYNFKNNKVTSFIVSGPFFHMSINIVAKFIFY